MNKYNAKVLLSLTIKLEDIEAENRGEVKEIILNHVEALNLDVEGIKYEAINIEIDRSN